MWNFLSYLFSPSCDKNFLSVAPIYFNTLLRERRLERIGTPTYLNDFHPKFIVKSMVVAISRKVEPR